MKRFDKAPPPAEPIDDLDVGANDEDLTQTDLVDGEPELGDAYDFTPSDDPSAAGDYADQQYDETQSERAEVRATAADHGTARPSDGLATALLALGALLMLCGFVLASVWQLAAAAGLRELLTSSGIRPIDAIVLGLVLAGIGSVRLGMRRHGAEMAAAVEAGLRGAAPTEELQAQLAELLSKSAERGAGADSPAGAVHQILHLVKRQEEKIINLSKATKMYGKPLLEITNRISESSHQIGEMISTVNAVKVIVEQSSARLESTLRTELAKPDGAEGEVKEAVRATREAVGRFEALQRELSQALNASTDKVSAEVHEATRDSQRTLQELERDLAATVKDQVEKLGKEMQQLDRRVEHARAAVVTGMKSLGESHQAAAPVPTDLTDALERMRQEIGGLTGEITALKQARPAAPAKAAAAAAPNDDDGDGDGTPAKAPKAGGKGVHNAIAKLKQMRQ